MNFVSQRRVYEAFYQDINTVWYRFCVLVCHTNHRFLNKSASWIVVPPKCINCYSNVNYWLIEMCLVRDCYHCEVVGHYQQTPYVPYTKFWTILSKIKNKLQIIDGKTIINNGNWIINVRETKKIGSMEWWRPESTKKQKIVCKKWKKRPSANFVSPELHRIELFWDNIHISNFWLWEQLAI